MSDLVKSELNSTKVTNPSGRGTRGRGKKDAKTMNDRAAVTIEVKETDSENIDAIADTTMPDAAVAMADAEFGAAVHAYVDRSASNMQRFSQLARTVQANNAQAIRQHAYETFGVTEESLYGTEADS